MNKSTCEKVTGGALKKTAPGSWILIISTPDGPGCIPGHGLKDTRVFQEIHDEFWKIRKAEAFKRDGYRCVMCSSPFQIECDHKVNRSQGGTHDLSNLQVLCRECHYAKTNLKGRWAKSKNA